MDNQLDVIAMEIIKSKILEKNNSIITIRNFVAADIDYVILRHQILYKEEYGLSSVFSDYVETGVHHFAHHYNSEKECMLVAEMNGQPVGSIVIVKADEETAQLRYLLLEPKTRGRGLGAKLVDMALDFCRGKGYKHVFLETICFLEAARHIYASKGFIISKSNENPTWGKDVLEERWDLEL